MTPDVLSPREHAARQPKGHLQPLIRRATATDVEQLAPLFDDYRQFYGAGSDVDAARAFLAERIAREESVVLLAWDGAASASAGGSAGGSATPIGFAQLYPSFSSISLGRVTVLNDLFVQPAARRSGTARGLVLESARWASGAGSIRLDLATQHANTPARRLYESLGFLAETDFLHLGLSLPHATLP